MRLSRLILLASISATMMMPINASAETLREALALAYANNPSINAQRASTRAIDEAVAIAKSGYRPQISGNASIGKSWTEQTGPNFLSGNIETTKTILKPGGFGVTISQNLFDGFQTLNNVASAKAGVHASRETLRNVEQNILFDAATAYMDVIRDQAIASYRSQALKFLNEQVRSENARFEVGESTRTDVAQARSRRAAAQAQLSAARAQLQTSNAIYYQLIGIEPRNLRRSSSVSNLLPNSVSDGIVISRETHPAILATRHLVDQAIYNVKSAEGQMLPGVSLNATANRNTDVATNTDRDSAQITATLTVPIYQGGGVSATVRQNKETLGQRRIEVDQAVQNVRAAVVSAYSQLTSARASASANKTQLSSAKLALEGAVEERKEGLRTTLDVLDTQQEVINAQIASAQSSRDIVVASYAALSSIGRLDIDQLNLKVVRYEPEDHYILVKDKWFGLRTPDGQ